jgi:hypothetical protein
MSKLIQLRKVVASLTECDFEPERPQRTWLDGPIERTTKIYAKRGKYIEIDSEGVPPFNDFVASVWNGNSEYQRCVSLNRLSQATLKLIVDNFSERVSESIRYEDVVRISDLITEWISEEIRDRKHFIACGVTQDFANAFKMGPVSFQHLNDFNRTERAASHKDETIDRAMVHFWSHYAHWAATVDITRCEAERSRELAELAVDLSLVGVQLVVPVKYSRHMARKNARQVPAPIQNVSIADGRGHVEQRYYIAGMDWTVGGDLLNRERFEQFLEIGDATLQSIGRRVSNFITGTDKAPGLEQAWCDSAYWFHEGLAEPLDAIAVPKLETAIEVLFRSANLTGSERRVLNAIRAFYGLEPDYVILAEPQITVRTLVKSFIRDRSRILHGTWSTLATYLRDSRSSLELLVRELLTNYSMELDTYVMSSGQDNLDNFLEWVQKRQVRANVSSK